LKPSLPLAVNSCELPVLIVTDDGLIVRGELDGPTVLDEPPQPFTAKAKANANARGRRGFSPGLKSAVALSREVAARADTCVGVMLALKKRPEPEISEVDLSSSRSAWVAGQIDISSKGGP
jgi:hypothetical protein